MRALTYLLALILGAIAGGSMVGLWLDRSDQLDAKDWLQFAGTAAGVILTVLLTLAVENYRQATAKRDAVRQLLRAARRVRHVSGVLRVIPNDPRPYDERVTTARGLQWELRRTTGQFLYAANRVDIDDIVVWQAVEDAKATIEQFADLLKREAEIVSRPGVTEAEYAINQQNVELPAATIDFAMLALLEVERRER